MDGSLTINVVAMCFFVASVAVGITLWVVYRFQTKTDARESEARLVADIAEESRKREDAFRGIQDQVRALRVETKEEMQRIQLDIHSMRADWSAVAKDISYIKGRLEPKAGLG